ncbi:MULTISPECIES: hypothetical protein [unclassified Psychrobacter]|uniref:hypothetical protein n=1 Tax=unclassified Psychrobacter TaxID=196806 RepID=UPI00071E7813|nr:MULTISPECIES: hypothetical protein [unclassified Psychrobacter]OLF38942.1 hypothetical protein BTV98_00470 [Psychrobacter sp. Cmf 22.2]
MSQIIKHSFEAVSLLTTDNGMLEVTIIPAANQPDWIIPSSLILSVDDSNERVWTYQWEQKEVAVFHLLPHEQPINKTIVLEGNTNAHRFALQTAGNLHHMKVSISEVKDAELPEHYLQVSIDNNNATSNEQEERAVSSQFKENIITSYMFLTVTINDTTYLIPDLDKIAHQLIDLND